MNGNEETVREIIARRDGLSDDEIDDMMAEFSDLLDEGEDPEQALQDVFGLEPDYVWDNEIQGRIIS
jgi:hypothetical protein